MFVSVYPDFYFWIYTPHIDEKKEKENSKKNQSLLFFVAKLKNNYHTEATSVVTKKGINVQQQISNCLQAVVECG